MQTLDDLRQLRDVDPRYHQVFHVVVVEYGEKPFARNELNLLLGKSVMNTLDHDSVGAGKLLEYADQF